MIFWIIIGSSFYKLADLYGKNKWVYVLIGIGIAIASQLLVGLLYGIITQPTEEELGNDSLAINLIAVLVSGIIVYIVYDRLKRKNIVEENKKLDEIESIGTNLVEVEKD